MTIIKLVQGYLALDINEFPGFWQNEITRLLKTQLFQEIYTRRFKNLVTGTETIFYDPQFYLNILEQNGYKQDICAIWKKTKSLPASEWIEVVLIIYKLLSMFFPFIPVFIPVYLVKISIDEWCQDA